MCVNQSLHTKVVRQYQQHYRDGPPTSGDEECLYWMQFLTYHMAKANLTQVKVIIITKIHFFIVLESNNIKEWGTIESHEACFISFPVPS